METIHELISKNRITEALDQVKIMAGQDFKSDVTQLFMRHNSLQGKIIKGTIGAESINIERGQTVESILILVKKIELYQDYSKSEKIDNSDLVETSTKHSHFDHKDETNINQSSFNSGAAHGPIVIPFGPTNTGKTITLLRLTRYIMNQYGLQIRVNRSFRTDNDYVRVCRLYEANVLHDSNLSLPAKNKSCLLLDVYKNSELYFQFLDSPGRDFFNPSDLMEPRKNFKAYIQNIINGPNKKIYLFFFEENMFGNSKERITYAAKVGNLIKNINPSRDKVIILHSKIDQNPYLSNSLGGKTNNNKNTLRYEIFSNPDYRFIYKSIKNYKIRDITYLPYSNGYFPVMNETQETKWILGDDIYPQIVFSAIESSLEPRSFWSRLFRFGHN